MKCTKLGAAYWRGNALNDSLQRVYGVSFPDKKGMAAWQLRMEEAKKRDHRLLGQKQNLFFFNPIRYLSTPPINAYASYSADALWVFWVPSAPRSLDSAAWVSRVVGSPGSCFFMPHGARIYNTLMNFIKQQYWMRGYDEVRHNYIGL
jgi:threonyl-tRNA synthetase